VFASKRVTNMQHQYKWRIRITEILALKFTVQLGQEGWTVLPTHRFCPRDFLFEAEND
jgi:hypothetical protein